MTLQIGDKWIRSDRCPQTAMAIPSGRWVLSWRPGCYDLRQAMAAMALAEKGDLLTDPAGAAETP